MDTSGTCASNEESRQPMAYSVQMPALGESVTEGTVTRWLKKEGDTVEVDEPLLEVSTDKVDTEIPSPAAGVLQRIVVAEDETVEVGAELAVIGDAPIDAAAAIRPERQPSSSPRAGQSAPGDRTGSHSRVQPAATAGCAANPGRRGLRDTAVTMPALGESVTEGTVTRWLKQVGDAVAVDEPLLEVSTDKVDTEIPSPVAGTVLEILAAEDETVEVGGHAGHRRATARPSAGEPSPSHSRIGPKTPRRARAGPPTVPRHQAALSADTDGAAAGGAPLCDTVGPQARDRAWRLTCRSCRAPGSAAGSASRMCSPPSKRPNPSRPLRSNRRQRPNRGSRRPPPQRAPPSLRRQPPSRAARPRRCPGCAASSPSGWSSRCRSPRSSPPWWRSTSPVSPGCASDQTGLRGPRGRQAVVPAVLRPGHRRGAQGTPEGQRLDRHRSGRHHLPRCGASRHRRGHRARPARAGDPRCG